MFFLRDNMRLKLSADLAILMIICGLQVFVSSHVQYVVKKALEDKALTGFAFRNLTKKTVVECFLACFEDCLCLSFQISKEKECQLLSSNQFKSTLDTVTGTTYYYMTPMSPTKVGLASSTLCSYDCHISPCQNGGKLELLYPTDYTTPRFKCECTPGYAGNLCEDVVKSCHGYSNSIRVSGLYKIFDDEMNLFDVFCDFDLNSTISWTLIQSYQLGNNKLFQTKPYTVDYPFNENTHYWDGYRLSKFRMQSIQKDSTKFRITCSYDTDGVAYRDYLQVANDDFDILLWSVNSCVMVEWVNIRGYDCKNCTAHLIQNTREILHIDSYYNLGCEFKAKESLSCAGPGEDSFGLYYCVNPTHRCSLSLSATTQTWFGGN